MQFLIADDHNLIQQALATWLRDSFPAAGIKITQSGSSAEALVRTEQPSAIILDISLPDKSGLDVLKQLRSEDINIPVLILSNHSEDQYALRAFKAGANGYLMKNCTQEEFVNALKIVLIGRKYISHNIAEKMVALMNSNDAQELHEIISDRELQVLQLLASGKSVSEIANDLSLGVATVSTYRARLLEKMKMKNNAELTRYAIDNGLV